MGARLRSVQQHREKPFVGQQREALESMSIVSFRCKRKQRAGERDHHRDPAKRGGHRDDGHEEEILQADSKTKKKVTNNDDYINLKRHQRIRTRMNKYWIIGMDERKRCGDHTS